MRNTLQRAAVLNDLKHRSDHPTAEMVYTTVKNDIPNISLATVYRNLRGLAKDEEIISFTQNGKEHFDGNTVPHVHLCCKSCGRIEDLMLTKESFEKMDFPEDFLVRNIVVEGLCKDCRQKLMASEASDMSDVSDIEEINSDIEEIKAEEPEKRAVNE
ncbi:MAG: transcriptional repressor [Lachnospiraceae bacterium]|nr:transcriptional repressor [Lachnospiraceae bacterium]